MKPTFRFYTSDKDAVFTYGDKKLVLKKNDQFQLDSFESRPVVIKDGFRWPVKPTLVRELVKRSEVAKVTKSNKKLVQDFDALGHKYLKYVSRKMLELDSSAKSGFTNNQVWAYYNYVSVNGPRTVALTISPNQVAVALYTASDKPIKPANSTQLKYVYSLMNAVLSLLEKDGAEVGTYKKLVIHAANISLPWGPKFSGTIYSNAAKYSIY